jgi:hypothetical protein
MQPERRCTPRRRPEELSYIQFEPEGGGIVVNASEQGLAFQVAAPLRQSGPVQLCVSPNPTQQIKLAAEIAWMDLTKKSGGLRFTEVSADARNQISEWLTKTRESGNSDLKFVVPSCAPKEETDPHTGARSGMPNLPPPSPLLDNAIPSGADAAKLPSARFRDIPAKELVTAPLSKETRIAISRRRLQRDFATGFLSFVFVFIAILFLQDFRFEIGNALIRMGEKLKGKGDTQAVDPSPAPVQSSNPSPAATMPSAPDPIPVAPANETTVQDEPAASPQTVQGIVNSADSLPVDRSNSPPHSPDAHTRRGRRDPARQLWSALAAGDSSAEVALAQLYLTGDGVPRNCEQARVLLKAAAKNGNSEAQQKLRKLTSSACQ